MMKNISKKIFTILASAIITFCITITAATPTVLAVDKAKTNMVTFTHWFGSGYTRYYDGMWYDAITYTDGSLYVVGTAKQAYSPEDLEGDYIKFGTVQYNSDIIDFIFDTDHLTNGSFYVEDVTPSWVISSTKKYEIWCKHAWFGLKEGFVLDFKMVPKVSGINTTITIFDTDFIVEEVTPPAIDPVQTTAATTTIVTTTATEPTTTTTVETTPRPTIYPENSVTTTYITTNTTTTAAVTETTTTTTAPDDIVDKEYSIFDINKDGKVNWDDVKALIAYIFIHGEDT